MNDDVFASLTPRERECLRGVRALQGSGEIARDLGIATGTVDAYLATAKVKLGARDRKHAALLFAEYESAEHRPVDAPDDELTPAMIGRIDDLNISDRTKHALQLDNMFFVGDLVIHSEAELLRFPDLGKESVNEIKIALDEVGLRLSMNVAGWPPTNIEEAEASLIAARRAAELQQSQGGAIFTVAEDHFVMTAGGDESDAFAAQKPMTRQMQVALREKTRDFADVAVRLDNQPGWKGVARTASLLNDLLATPPDKVPDILGYLYPAAIELGSFLELDEQLAGGGPSYAAPLDPEVRRPLGDLVRNLAPWLRSFPSIRDADDEAARFLVKAAELKPVFDVMHAAGAHALISDADLQVFRQLHDAAERGTFQGEKAGGRAKRSASNFVIGTIAFAGSFFAGAVASDFATTSPLVHRIGQFLVQTEIAIEALVSDLPRDLRFSITEFVGDLPKQPPSLPDPRNPGDGSSRDQVRRTTRRRSR